MPETPTENTSNKEAPTNKEETAHQEVKPVRKKRGATVPLSLKFSFGIAILIIVSMVTVGWLILNNQRKVIQEQLVARGVVQAQSVADNAAEFIIIQDELSLIKLLSDSTEEKTGLDVGSASSVIPLPEQIRRLINEVAMEIVTQIWGEEAGGSDIVYAQAVDRDGMVIAADDVNAMFRPYVALPGMRPNPSHEPLVQNAWFEAGDTDNDIFDVEIPVTYVKKYLGSIHMGLSKRTMTYALRLGLVTMGLVVVVVLVVAIILTMIIVAIMIRPIGFLVKGVQAISEGDLNQTINLKRNDELGELTDAFNDMAESLREKEKMRGAFTKYVSADVMNEALSGDSVSVGGEKRNVTIFFSDIAGFTTISEAMAPEDLVLLLNEYFDEMVKILDRHEGTLDKFIGDAIMAVYGAPRKVENHGLKCVLASLEMNQKMTELRPKWASEGKPEMRIRMGIATDNVIVGNVGSSARIQYTAIGDGVNLAARLESLGKVYGVNILMEENTWNQAKEKVLARELDLVTVKGKTEPRRIFEAMCLMESATTQDKTIVEQFHYGLGLYRQQKWDDAIKHFEYILKIKPDDRPAAEFNERCAKFKSSPPSADWDGVLKMLTK